MTSLPAQGGCYILILKRRKKGVHTPKGRPGPGSPPCPRDAAREGAGAGSQRCPEHLSGSCEAGRLLKKVIFNPFFIIIIYFSPLQSCKT